MDPFHDLSKSSNLPHLHESKGSASLPEQIAIPPTIAPQALHGNLPPVDEQKAAYGIEKEVHIEGVLHCLSPANISSEQVSRFHELNKQEINTGVIGRIRKCIGRIIQKIGLDLSFKWQTHMHAEHMSQGSLSGSSSSFATGKTVEVLEKMKASPPKELIEALNYAKSVSQGRIARDLPLLLTGIGGVAANLISASIIKNDIKNLQIGQSLAIPSDSRGHCMMLFITREADGTFKVVQHNQGEGIKAHHYKKVDENGKHLYQTALEITGVSEQNLCGIGSFERLHWKSLRNLSIV